MMAGVGHSARLCFRSDHRAELLYGHIQLLALAGSLLQHSVVVHIAANTEEEALECKYTFPILENAAVVKFEATFGTNTIKARCCSVARPVVLWADHPGRHWQGVVKEKALAKKEYEQAVAENKKAALMEQEKPDVFTCVRSACSLACSIVR